MLEYGTPSLEGSLFSFNLKAMNTQIMWQEDTMFQGSCHALSLLFCVEWELLIREI